MFIYRWCMYSGYLVTTVNDGKALSENVRRRNKFQRKYWAKMESSLWERLYREDRDTRMGKYPQVGFALIFFFSFSPPFYLLFPFFSFSLFYFSLFLLSIQAISALPETPRIIRMRSDPKFSVLAREK